MGLDVNGKSVRCPCDDDPEQGMGLHPPACAWHVNGKLDQELESMRFWALQGHRASALLADFEHPKEALEDTARWVAEEVRAARVTLRTIRDDVERALAHRRAVDTGGQRVGHGGPLGMAPPSALLYLAGLLGVKS